MRPVTSDSLWVFQPTVSSPQAYLCVTRQEPAKIYVVSEHLPTAEQTALKFKSVYTEKMRILNPGIFPAPPQGVPNLFQLPPGFPPLVPQAALAGTSDAAAKAVNFVAKGYLFAGRPSEGDLHVDLFELFDDLVAQTTPGVFFDPDVYPAVVWLEPGKTRESPPLRTLVYPSGVVVVHGCDSAELLVEYYQRKLPYLVKFLRQ